MVKDIIASAFDFIGAHILDIVLVVLLLFCLVVYIVLNNIKFPKSHPVLQRVVVLENLDNIDPETKDSDTVSEIESSAEKTTQKKLKTPSICHGGLEAKNKTCSSLATKDSCSTDCCVWAKKNKTKHFSCVGGDESGATYDSQDYDAYYYKNKRFPKK
jgi:hypothetical protein